LDDSTPRGRIAYRVYSGLGEQPVNTQAPVAVSIPGETSVVVSGLASSQSYRFVVRAVDAEGNEDDNRHAVTVTTNDTGAPVFAGVTGAHSLTSRRMLIQWKPAEDEVTPAQELRYRVYVSTSNDPDVAFDEPVATSAPGATSLEIDELPADSELFVGVRVVDGNGNEDENTRLISTLTPEGNAPDFDGVRTAIPDTTSIELRWAPAADDATASSEIVYAIYLSTTASGHNLLAPHTLTDPGVTRWTVTGLEPDTTYHFIVRARDLAGNEDGNSFVLSSSTAPPDETAPVFAGATGLLATTPTSLRVTWDAASDDRTPTDELLYDIYLAEGGGTPDTSGRPHLTTLPGRTSADLLSLKTGTDYALVVRARDEAGNGDTNTAVLKTSTNAATSDVSAPLLSGSMSLTQVSEQPDRLLVNLPKATDDTVGAAGIRFHVCVAESGTECTGADFIEHVNATSEFGATTVFVTGLNPRTTYRATVRAEDKSGNLGSASMTSEGVTATSFQTNVAPILESRCNQCHNYEYGTLVHVPSGYADMFLISAGEPAQSYLFRKLRALDDQTDPFSETEPSVYEGARMPSDNTEPLTNDVQAVLLDWIAQGAFDN
jgi:chitodextrinase